MDSIKYKNCYIHFNAKSYKKLNDYVKNGKFSTVFILVDINTHEYCLPNFLSNVEFDNTIEIIEIEAGEEFKTIDTCTSVWKALSELDADRKSLIINLGGGVVTDLGGFVSCTYKRGIKFINVPTTLLSMVDASIGGKTGVDLDHLKNQIGVISNPIMVLIDTSYLNTLPNNQMRSGLAEMLKHGLIKDKDYWDKFKNLSLLDFNDLDYLIYESVIIKKDIVEEDPFENNIRKSLNFGHTLGHAIESYFLSSNTKATLLHGEAIAIGMILEIYISQKLCGFPEDLCLNVKQHIKKVFGHVEISSTDYKPIIELLKYDKKNEYGNINFLLLERIGTPKINCQVEEDLILEAFKFYNI